MIKNIKKLSLKIIGDCNALSKKMEARKNLRFFLLTNPVIETKNGVLTRLTKHCRDGFAGELLHRFMDKNIVYEDYIEIKWDCFGMAKASNFTWCPIKLDDYDIDIPAKIENPHKLTEGEIIVTLFILINIGLPVFGFFFLK